MRMTNVENDELFVDTWSFIEFAMLKPNQHITVKALNTLEPEGTHYLTNIEKCDENEEQVKTYWDIELSEKLPVGLLPCACLLVPTRFLLEHLNMKQTQ